MKKLMLALVTAFAAMISFGEEIVPTAFTKKCEFTVSGYTGATTLTDFPVLIRLKAGAPVGFDYADCQADGSDLRFADSEGTLLAHEIDTWNPAGESLIWVKVPTLAGAETTVTAYYGANPSSIPAATPRVVWSKYVTVIHGGTTIDDSSPKALTLTANSVTGTEAGDAGGIIGGGMYKKDRKTIGVNIPNPYKNNLFTNNRQYSISFWAKSPNASSGTTHVTMCGVTDWGHAGFLGLFEKGNGWSVAVNGQHHYNGNGALPANVWTYTAFSYDTALGKYSSYSNAEKIGDWTDTAKGVYTDTNVDFWTLGGYANTAKDDNFNGDLDECRIYDGIASADWFKAEYDSMNNVAFAVGGVVEDVETTPEPSIASVVADCTMTSLGLNISILGFGDGASSCDLHAVLASDADYQNVLDSFDKTAAEVDVGAVFSIGAQGLHYGTPYYLKVEATNDKEKKATVEKIYETLPAPACATTFVQEKIGSAMASFIWSLSAFGEMSSYASVAVEWDTSDAFSAPSSLELFAKLEEPMPETRVVVRDLAASQQYYFRLKTVNECGTIGYSRMISGVTTATEVNRIWANTGMDMNDPASYVENLLPGDGDIIYFVEPVKTQPYLSSDLFAKGIFFGRYDMERTSADADPTGYVITGADGAKLTLTGSGDGANYAVNSATTAGEAEINVPIVLSGNNPHLAANGMRIDLSGAISTTKEYQQDVQTQSSGADSSHMGYLVFSAANPDFKPSMIHWSSGHLMYGHPQALMSVKTINSGLWGGIVPHIYNISGEPMVMDMLENINPESHGLDGIYFEGSPFIMTNAVFKVSQRNSKARDFNAVVSFKNIGGWDYSGDTFDKRGTNMLEVVGDYIEGSDIVSHIQIVRGLFYPHKLLETVARTDRRCRLNGDGSNDSTQPYPTLGVDKDARIPVSNLGGISFGKDSEVKGGGLSGMGGEVKVTLTDKSDNPLTLEYGVKTPEGSGYLLPNPFAFGHFAATGTVILENDIVNNNGGYDMCAFQGEENVAGRYAGNMTLKGGDFVKSGNGVLAFEGTLAIPSGNWVQVNGGGLLVNTDLSGFIGDIRLNNSAWIGGTGVVAHIHKESGNAYGAIRPGEFGKGTLTVKGTKDSKFAANTGFIADITAAGTTGLLKLEGDINTYSSGWSGYWMRVEPQDGAPAGKYKIMDWSDATGTPNNIKWIKADSYTVQYDASKVKKAELSVEGTAMYLDFEPRAAHGGLLIIVR